MKNPFFDNKSNIYKEMCECRHFLHSHPELSLEESITSDFIFNFLRDKANIKVEQIHRGYAKHGVVAIIDGNGGASESRKTIALRADMDALPLEEKANPLCENGVSFKSIHANKMHACAHDIHMAALLGAAIYLNQNQNKNFNGQVILIFQPGEEGLFGAKLMIEDGLLDKFKMDAIFGLHIWPDLPFGEWGITEGAAMANSDMFTIKIRGHGGHGALPHKTKDPIIVSAHLILALQNLISRMNNPFSPAVLSITQINSGTTHNIIPEEAVIAGTLRTLSTEVQSSLIEKIKQITNGIASTFDCTIDLDYQFGYPVMINSSKEAKFCSSVVNKIFPGSKVHHSMTASLGGEDFAYFLQKIPGNMIKLGVLGNDNKNISLHNPYFVPSDEIMLAAAGYWIGLVNNYLK
ncbi:MAG: amidohydrolase [Oligoflexia bacterium]|nr:amidohydrolase [Oligoflexia bacterium]